MIGTETRAGTDFWELATGLGAAIVHLTKPCDWMKEHTIAARARLQHEKVRCLSIGGYDPFRLKLLENLLFGLFNFISIYQPQTHKILGLYLDRHRTA